MDIVLILAVLGGYYAFEILDIIVVIRVVQSISLTQKAVTFILHKLSSSCEWSTSCFLLLDMLTVCLLLGFDALDHFLNLALSLSGFFLILVLWIYRGDLGNRCFRI